MPKIIVLTDNETTSLKHQLNILLNQTPTTLHNTTAYFLREILRKLEE